MFAVGVCVCLLAFQLNHVSECYGRQYGGYPAIIFLLKTSITIINSVVDKGLG